MKKLNFLAVRLDGAPLGASREIGHKYFFILYKHLYSLVILAPSMRTAGMK